MIIVDYNGLCVGTVASQKLELKEDIIRHVILNQIRWIRSKFKNEYGEVVLAVDSGNTWRRDMFPFYKAKRREKRQTDKQDWQEVYRILDLIREEIKENFPYKVVKIDRCEADDIIGVLVEDTQEFGKYENVMIISADKDFIQLQKYKNVKQFSPLFKKFVSEDNPLSYLETHILKGDTADGIPNVLSNDDVFVEGFRQTPLRQKRIDEIITDLSDGELLYAASWYRNYLRNKKLIDLSQTPEDLKKEIINNFTNQDPWSNKGKVFPYMVSKRLNQLIQDVTEFIQ